MLINFNLLLLYRPILREIVIILRPIGDLHNSILGYTLVEITFSFFLPSFSETIIYFMAFMHGP